MAPAEGWQGKAWATLLTKTSYLQGALVLADSLARQRSKFPLVVFATQELPQVARDILDARRIPVRDIDYLEPPRENRGQLDEHDRRFADTWTKLRVFEMTEFERLVLLDSDMLCVRNMDELLEMPLDEGWIAAAHACTCNPRKLAHYPKEWIPENCGHTQARLTTPLAPSDFSKPTHDRLNSGLVVLRPSRSTFEGIVSFLNTDPRVAAYKFPDQDLIADFFKDRFLPISYRYNALKTLRYCHAEMWRDEDVKIVHFILKKPWYYMLPESDPDHELHTWWWKAFDELEASWGDAPHWNVIEATVNRELRRDDLD
ncbi:glycosyltransferase family 8 protein [Rhodotorula toruloides]|uniref:Glycosyltransferase family 8 protein n=1 Tax=Rhodotorula toruloides TaxID=5286 RepID=A0A511KDF6_RHOTO|nr:glycosyltransferase family 8 protein [Rhodotorula toruloides]